MPGRGDQQHDHRTTQGPQPLPGSAGKQLFSKKEVDQSRRNGENNAYQTLEQKPGAEACSKNGRPKSRSFFLLVQRPQKCPESKCNGESEHDIGNLNAREEKQTDARGHTQSRIKPGSFSEGPHAERGGQKCERDGSEGHRKPSGP